MKQHATILCIILAALLFRVNPLGAEDFKDFSELNLDDLLNTEVYSASSYMQKALDAPASVTVITEKTYNNTATARLPRYCGACEDFMFPMTATIPTWEPVVFHSPEITTPVSCCYWTAIA